MELFRKMRGLPEFPSEQKGAGDVLSHLSEYSICIDYFSADLFDLYFFLCVMILRVLYYVCPFVLPLSATDLVAIGFLPLLAPPIRTRTPMFSVRAFLDIILNCVILPPSSSF